MKTESGLRQRVIDAAEDFLERNNSVSVLDMLMGIRWLEPSHIRSWKRAEYSYYDNLEKCMMSKPDKREKALTYFEEWAKEKGLEATTAEYYARTRHGGNELQITENGDPEQEKRFRQQFLKPGITQKQKEKIEEKTKKKPDLLTFISFKEENCAECNAHIDKGEMIFFETGKTLCLSCADLDHLEFLPSGDPALTRRAKKHSPIWVVVLKHNRRQRRQERQGLLLTPGAILKAEQECLNDEEQRIRRKEYNEKRRDKQDEQFVNEMTSAILQLYPGCPKKEAKEIAERTCQRGSGRVGRSQAGRNLDNDAVALAVIAHIRHAHTNYDTLLMTCSDRQRAREIIYPRVDAILKKWQTSE